MGRAVAARPHREPSCDRWQHATNPNPTESERPVANGVQYREDDQGQPERKHDDGRVSLPDVGASGHDLSAYQYDYRSSDGRDPPRQRRRHALAAVVEAMTPTCTTPISVSAASNPDFKGVPPWAMRFCAPSERQGDAQPVCGECADGWIDRPLVGRQPAREQVRFVPERVDAVRNDHGPRSAEHRHATTLPRRDLGISQRDANICSRSRRAARLRRRARAGVRSRSSALDCWASPLRGTADAKT